MSAARYGEQDARRMRLLLLPGMDGTGTLFEPLLEALPASLPATVVAYPCDKPYGYSELLPFVEEAAPAEDAFVVLGESFSGPLALMAAARRPPGLRGVILCASFARSPLRACVSRLRGLVRPWWFRATPLALLSWALLGRRTTDRLRHLLREAAGRVDPAVMAARARAVLSVDVETELRVCPVPILYLSGTEDRVVSARSLANIRRVRPDVETMAIVAPHLVLQAAAKEAARAIERFAATCAALKSGTGL